MRKGRILPKLAMTGVLKNGSLYFPYMGAGVFAVFTYFVFTSILHNDIIETLPKSAYAFMLLMVGKVLLGLIILPFLFYTNSFLIKRRRTELGLYSVLGLEKKHIGVMLFCETLLVYLAAVAGGILAGVVFSKLIFLLLLNMAGLPVDARFQFKTAAFQETLLYFALVYCVNLAANLWEVSRSKPVRLLSGAKKGEKEPGFLPLLALLGAAALGGGYYIAVTSVIDSNIYTNFFLAVLLVAVGTYLLFTSGSIVVLRRMKKNRRLYYRPEYFITISGMLYRMKKSAASLSNICIFATMVLITMSCTLSLFLGSQGIMEFDYPYDLEVSFARNAVEREEIRQTLQKQAKAAGVELEDMEFLPHYLLGYKKSGSSLVKKEDLFGNDTHDVGWLSLDAYHELTGTDQELAEEEAIVFSTGPDWEEDTISVNGRTFRIVDKPQDIKLFGKDDGNVFLTEYYVVLQNQALVEEQAAAWRENMGAEQVTGSDDLYLNIAGEEAAVNTFMTEFEKWCGETQALRTFQNNFEQRQKISSMNGGLLFIGVIFGITFLLCMILIMYYKQIAEGYEDRYNFEIMQKVGMSDDEIRRTVSKQVLLVFALPLLGALCHTAVGMQMVNQLFGTIRLFDRTLILQCTVIVGLFVAVVYAVSYRITAGAYYRIVKQ